MTHRATQLNSADELYKIVSLVAWCAERCDCEVPALLKLAETCATGGLHTIR